VKHDSNPRRRYQNFQNYKTLKRNWKVKIQGKDMNNTFFKAGKKAPD